MKNLKVIIIHNIMAPCRFPLFSEIAKDPTINLEVWFLSESAQNRRWRVNSEIKLPFKYRVLPKVEVNFRRKDLFTWIFNPTFPIDFLKSNCDVLISAGWLDFASQFGFFLCKLLDKPFVLWSESTINEPSWRRNLAMPLVRTMVKNSDACIPTSTRAEEYLLQLGANPEKIFLGISTVDIKHFARVCKVTSEQKENLKQELGIKTERLILYVGQFLGRKGIKSLLSAFKIIKKTHDDIGLLLVGYGPQEEELKEIRKREGLRDVYFSGHVEVEEMPKMYGLADIFVLPSTEETFGLVINEAMAAGLPVITTDKVGASLDLIKEGYNGYIVPAADRQALAEALLKIIKSTDLCKKMGENSKRIIGSFGPEAQAKSFLQAINYVISDKN